MIGKEITHLIESFKGVYIFTKSYLSYKNVLTKNMGSFLNQL